MHWTNLQEITILRAICSIITHQSDVMIVQTSPIFSLFLDTAGLPLWSYSTDILPILNQLHQLYRAEFNSFINIKLTESHKSFHKLTAWTAVQLD
jgi:hypothetical protein